MAITADMLRSLHRLHGQLAELRSQIERGPRLIKAHEANCQKQQGLVDEAKLAVQQSKMLADRKQLDLRATESRIADWERKLDQAANNKEYQALTEQVAATKMAASVLADEVLELFDRIEQLEASATEAQRQLTAATTEMQRVRASIEAAAAGLQEQAAAVEADLRAAEAELPADFRGEYRRMVASKGEQGMAPVEEGVCGGCGQSITLNMQNDLLMSRAVFCKSCGCLLYLAEG